MTKIILLNSCLKLYRAFCKREQIDRLSSDAVVAPYGTKNLSLSPRRRLRVNGGGCKKRPRIPRDEKRCSRNGARVVERSRAEKESVSPLVLVGVWRLIVVVEAEQLRRKSSVPAAECQTEHADCQPKLRAHGSEDHRFPETVHHPQPQYRKVEKRYLQSHEQIYELPNYLGGRSIF